MTYMLDTCIVADLLSPSPDIKLAHWLDAQPEETIFISVVTIAELKQTIDQVNSAKIRSEMNNWLMNDLLVRFKDRISEIDVNVSLRWGEISSKVKSLGRAMNPVDSLNLGIALLHDHVLVTRHTSQFEGTGVRLVNPYES